MIEVFLVGFDGSALTVCSMHRAPIAWIFIGMSSALMMIHIKSGKPIIKSEDNLSIFKDKKIKQKTIKSKVNYKRKVKSKVKKRKIKK